MKQFRRILAMLGSALLILMYLITLYCALFDTSRSMIMFKASVMCTILVPILIWGYTVIYRLAKGRHEQELEKALQELETKKEQKD